MTVPTEWTEYIPVTVASAVSVVISIYFSNKNATDFSLEPQMNLVPIALSIFSSVISGLVLLAFPQEAYVHGVTQNGNYIVMNVSVALFGLFIFIPTIYRLELVSLYEYYERRFDPRVRRLVSILYMVSQVVLGALTVYASSLFFRDCMINPIFSFRDLNKMLLLVSGVNFHFCSSFQILFCVICASLGGFKGVVWADAFQALIMIATLALFLAVGLVRVGGLDRVMTLAWDTDRLNVLELGLNPTKRSSFWSLLSDVVNVAYLVGGQSIHQRLMSVKSEKNAKRALLFGTIAIILFSMSCLLLGLTIYADYYGCDPKKAGIIKSYNQITSYWVNSVARDTPGMRGMFLAGLFCSSISTLSTILNTLCITMYIEFLQKRLAATRKTVDLTLTPIFGLVILATVVLIKDVGSFMDLHYTFRASIGCLIVSVFIVGILTESVTARGAFWGGVCSSLFLAAFITASKMSGSTDYETKYMSVEQCLGNISVSMSKKNETATTEFDLFRISPLNYNLIGFVISVCLSMLVSQCGGRDASLNRKPFDSLVWRPSRKPSVQFHEESPGLLQLPQR